MQTYSPIDVYIDAFFLQDLLLTSILGAPPWTYPAGFGQTLTLVLSLQLGRVVNRRTCVPCFATLRRRQSLGPENLGVLAFRHTLSIIALRTTKIFCESPSGTSSYPDQIDMCRIGSATRVAYTSYPVDVLWMHCHCKF